MKFFVADDFKIYSTTCFPSYEQYQVYVRSCAQTIADAANAKLMKDAKVVYSNKENTRWAVSDGDYNFATHRALLVCIEKIEVCSHIDAFHYTKITNDGPEYLSAWCKLCGSKFKLTDIK